MARWDELEIIWQDNLVRNLTQGTQFGFEPLPEGDLLMLEAGGIVGYLHERNKREQADG